jgi:L-cystine uptake protein TcyP (sodium:dicarboxylate symporter family)
MQTTAQTFPTTHGILARAAALALGLLGCAGGYPAILPIAVLAGLYVGGLLDAQG